MPLPRQDTHDEANEPQDSGHESKSLRGIPLSTQSVSQAHFVPVPRAAAVHGIGVPVLKQAEDGEPRAAEQEVCDDVGEGNGRAGNEPEESRSQRHGGYDGAVETSKGADAVLVLQVEEVRCQT